MSNEEGFRRFCSFLSYHHHGLEVHVDLCSNSRVSIFIRDLGYIAIIQLIVSFVIPTGTNGLSSVDDVIPGFCEYESV